MHGRLHLPGVGLQVAAHEARQDVDADDDRAERAEHIGHRVADGDVGLHDLHLVRRQAELGNGVPGRADDGGLGHAARRQPRRDALVEVEDLGQHHHRDQPRHGHEHRHGNLAQRTAVERVEELRAAFIAHRVDEDREHHGLHAVVDLHAHLADDHGRQQ
ncbi:hypothetical protein D3C72_1709470 [compost metagenome]